MPGLFVQVSIPLSTIFDRSQTQPFSILYSVRQIWRCIFPLTCPLVYYPSVMCSSVLVGCCTRTVRCIDSFHLKCTKDNLPVQVPSRPCSLAFVPYLRRLEGRLTRHAGLGHVQILVHSVLSCRDSRQSALRDLPPLSTSTYNDHPS
jgi:hypothetical protein